jgi:hypothetical protein
VTAGLSTFGIAILKCTKRSKNCRNQPAVPGYRGAVNFVVPITLDNVIRDLSALLRQRAASERSGAQCCRPDR